MSGIFSRRAVSYISRAQSQRYDRCLSLNTGTTRPLRSNTATIASKNRLRGYSCCPLALTGYLPCSPIDSTASTASRSPPRQSASAIVG